MYNPLFDIEKKEKELLEIASTKEKIFYYFLNGLKKLPFEINKPASEIEEICLAAFGYEKKELIEFKEYILRPKRSSLHFSENLIELIALSKMEPELTKDYIKQFIENRSTRDRYIISSLFPEIIFKENNVNLFEITVSEILINKKIFNPDYSTVFSEINDLIDLYLFKKIYMKTLYIDMQFLLEIHLRIFKFIRIFVNFSIAIAYLFFVFKFSIFLIQFATQKWATLEPYTAVIPWILSLFSMFVYLFFKKKTNTIKVVEFIKNKIQDIMLSLIYKIIRIDLKTLKKLKEKYE